MNLLTAKDVATRLQISERTARRLLARGKIRGLKVGPKIWRVPEKDVLEYIAREIEGRKAA